jgi:hypothetical protein
MRPGSLVISWISLLIGAVLSPGCVQGPVTEVGFVLVRLEDLEVRALSPRAGGLDRENVVEATCEILKADGTVTASETFEVDPEKMPGEQEVRLRGIRAGSNYFARILGLDADGAVYECGISGPVKIRSGKKHFVTIAVAPPPEEDPLCEKLCMHHEDCPLGSFCPSPLALPEPATGCIEQMNCTPALCKPFSVGAPCEDTWDCGPELGCIGEGYGYPNGYCMASCNTDGDCPQGSTWTSSCCPAEFVVNLGHPVCTLDCESDQDCRWEQGYVCKTIDAGKSGCLPQ